jgi:tetratricopeptide (TPR) repeat protein
MKPFVFLFLAVAGLLACADAAWAQVINLRDGQSVTTLGLRRDGATVMAKIKISDANTGEIGYPVANIARIDFPEPQQQKNASDLLDQGKAAEALKELAPAVAYYAPFRDVPGNWWAPLAILQVDALNSLGRSAEADAIVVDLSRAGAASPDQLRAIKIHQGATLERKGEHQKALDFLLPLVKAEDAAPESLGEAWLNIGAAHLALRNYKPALLAYLHVPVYSPDRAQLMPPALLGSAAALVALEDKTRAQETLKKLIAAYPASPEAAEAKKRFQKLAAPDADAAP